LFVFNIQIWENKQLIKPTKRDKPSAVTMWKYNSNLVSEPTYID